MQRRTISEKLQRLKLRHHESCERFHGWFRCSEFLIEFSLNFHSSLVGFEMNSFVISLQRSTIVCQLPRQLSEFQFTRELAAISLSCNCAASTHFFSLTMEEMWRSAEFELFAESEAFTFNRSPPDKAAASARHEISRKLRHWRSASNVKVRCFICNERKKREKERKR